MCGGDQMIFLQHFLLRHIGDVELVPRYSWRRDDASNIAYLEERFVWWLKDEGTPYVMHH